MISRPSGGTTITSDLLSLRTTTPSELTNETGDGISSRPESEPTSRRILLTKLSVVKLKKWNLPRQLHGLLFLQRSEKCPIVGISSPARTPAWTDEAHVYGNFNFPHEARSDAFLIMGSLQDKRDGIHVRNNDETSAIFVLSYAELKRRVFPISLLISVVYKRRFAREEQYVEFDKFGYYLVRFYPCVHRPPCVSPTFSPLRVLSLYLISLPLCRLLPFQAGSDSRSTRIIARSPTASFYVNSQVIVLFHFRGKGSEI